jgi:hypothetical protein
MPSVTPDPALEYDTALPVTLAKGKVISRTVGLGDLLIGVVGVTLPDVLGAGDSNAADMRYAAAIAEVLGAASDDEITWAMVLDHTLNTTDEASPLLAIIMLEQLGVLDSHALAYLLGVALTERMASVDVATVAMAAAIIDALGLTQETAALLAVRLQEVLALVPSQQLTATYSMFANENARFLDEVSRFLGALLSEDFGVAATVPHLLRMPATASDLLSVAADTSYSMVLRVDVPDGFSVSDDEIITALYAGALIDNLQFTIGAFGPAGGFTTWAVNTSTAAVTEYQGYSFNSFARVGTRYLGASESGLYRLDGDTSDGDVIVARVRTGAAQFAGSKMVTPDAAYLGIRGDGVFVLRMVVSDGRTFDYPVAVNSMRTARAKLGRGLRSRYFAVELESEGQDFDLDSIEILPLVLTRRV